MDESVRNSQTQNRIREIDLKKMQYQYVIVGFCLLPFSPFLYLQGQYTRWKVGRLPDAEGETTGVVGNGKEKLKLLAIGESTVAGIGAKTHKDALTVQFAKHLSAKTGKTIDWCARGVSGITIRQTLNEQISNVPESEFDVVVVALGGNDVFTLNSPESFRKDLNELIEVLRKKSPNAKMFLANVPMVRDFIALPNPLKYILSRLARLHHFNAMDLISKKQDVFYFDDVESVDDDFFSDGIHPSKKGYSQWAESMVESFLRKSDF